MFDVTPTVLDALGLPFSRELAGQAARALRTRSELVGYVDTYGQPTSSTAPREGQPLDQEMIDRLRSLGYVK